ncbi:MAG: hypothetical protein RLP44_25705 [Aggregatilineales bacterium]
MKKILLLIPFLLLASCTTEDTPNTMVTITYPANGTVIYAEALTVQGTLQGDSERPIQIVLANQDNQTTTTISGSTWSVEIPLNYSGEPLQTTLSIRSEDGATTYATSQLIIADLSYRPQGTFGTIIFPEDESTIGGDSIQIEGSASGIVGNFLTIRLIDSEDRVIREQTLIIVNPYFIDEVPWNVAIDLADVEEIAQVQLVSMDENGDEIILDEVNVTIETAAG